MVEYATFNIEQEKIGTIIPDSTSLWYAGKNAYKGVKIPIWRVDLIHISSIGKKEGGRGSRILILDNIIDAN